MISDTRLPRDHKIDMVKTAAIWSVVLCHVAAAPFSGGVVGTTSWYSAVLWTSLAHACVPLFFMASGALLLKPEKELTFQNGGADENLDQTEVEVSACIAMKNGKKQWNYISSMGIGQRQ